MRKPLSMKTALLAIGVLAVGLAGSATARAADENAQPWLGVYMQPLDDSMRDGLDYSGDGVLVNRIAPGGPAAQAGIRRGDVIIRLNDRAIRSPDDLSEAVSEGRVGETVSVRLVRDGREQTLRVTLADRVEEGSPRRIRSDEGDQDDDEMTPPVPPTAPMAPRAPIAPRAPRVRTPDSGWIDDLRQQIRDGMGSGMTMMQMGRGRLGVRVQDLSDDLGEYFGGSNGHGVLVLEVLDDTPAKRAGMRAGDVITRVEGKRIETSEDLVNTLRDSDGNVRIDVVRRGDHRTLDARLEPRVRGNVRYQRDLTQGDRRVIVRGGQDSDDREELRQQIRELKDEIRRLKDEQKQEDEDKR